MTTGILGTKGRGIAAPRWLLGAAGVAWLGIGVVILSMDAASVTTLAVTVGILLLVASAEELVAMVTASELRWLHGVLGALFVVGGFVAFLDTFQTFGVLALFIGWYLLGKGLVDMAVAVGTRGERPMWGLGLTVGILEVALGCWALGYPGRSAWLLLVWTGVGALLRGFGNLAAAFVGGAR